MCHKPEYDQLKTNIHHNIAIFIPEQGCPFQCIFCDQKQISGSVSSPKKEEVIAHIEESLSSFGHQQGRVELAFFGGNFTGISIEQQREYLGIAQPYLKSGKIHGIRLSTRPDYIDEANLRMLKDYGVSCIELGVQSMDSDVLKTVRRGYGPEAVEKACELIKKAGLRFGLQMMIGLPGDTLQKSLYTAREIIRLGASETRIYPSLVIKGTQMEQMWKEGNYQPMSLEESIDTCRILLTEFEQAGVKVLRMGLHPSEGLLNGDSLVAGPFHPAFGQLVETAIWKYKLKYLEQEADKENLTIWVNEKDFHAAIGHKGTNKAMLARWFKKLRIKTSIDIKPGNFHVDFC